MERKTQFTALIHENQGLIIKISRLYTNCLEDEEDLFQEIVLQLWRSYSSFNGDSKITTWMYRVALNTAITSLRKFKKNEGLHDTGDEIAFAKIPETEDNQLQERIDKLYRNIKKLPDIERAIVSMYLDDLSYREISENLGISEVNARVKMNRLKKMLKILMESDE